METRPRTASVDLGTCPVHGEVEVAKHSHGTDRAGLPRVSWICRECHLLYNKGQDTSRSGAVGFCNATTNAGSVSINCRRPFGHPADFHSSTDGGLWPVRKEV